MRVFIIAIVAIIAFYFGFWADGQLINWTLTQFPSSVHEWLGVIKIVLWFFTFSFTLAISILLAFGAGGLVTLLFERQDNKSKLKKMMNRKF